MKNRKTKRKLKFVHFGIVKDGTKSEKDQRYDVARMLAEELIEKGFVKFNEDVEIGGYTFLTATIYAVKII